MKRERSPGYPAINLEQALEAVSTIYKATKGHPVPSAQVHRTLGYSPNAGPAKKTVASIMQFGLLEAEGRGDQRRLSLSERALRIERDKSGESPERLSAILQAAEQPPIYQAITEKYGTDLPGSDVMETELKLEHSFTDGAAPVVVKRFRETLDFVASLGEGDVSGRRPDAVDVDFTEVGADIPMRQSATATEDRGQLVLNLRGGRAAFVLDGKADAAEADRIIQGVTLVLQQQRTDGDMPALLEGGGTN